MIRLSDASLIKRGKSWQASFYYIDPSTEERKRIYRSFPAEGKREAKNIRNRLRTELENELNESLRLASIENDVSKHEFAYSGSLTLQDYIDRYISHRKATKAVEPATLKKNITDSKRIGELLDCKVCDITEDMVSELVVELSRKNYAERTIRSTMRFLRQVLAHATTKGIIVKNPCQSVFLPKIPPQEINFLNSQQRVSFMNFLKSAELTPLVIAVFIALYTGARLGEICGSKWQFADFDNSALMIRKVIANNQEGGEYLKDIPKGRKFREAPLPNALANILRVWRSNFPKECEQYFILGSFTDPDKWYGKSRLGKEFSSLVSLLGYNISFHDLRHTFATYMVASGVDIVTLSHILGHADVSTTLNLYAAPDPSARLVAKELMERIDRPTEPGVSRSLNVVT